MRVLTLSAKIYKIKKNRQMRRFFLFCGDDYFFVFVGEFFAIIQQVVAADVDLNGFLIDLFNEIVLPNY